MHSLILVTAMSLSTGLFGGHKSCGGGGRMHHARASVGCAAPAPVSSCGASMGYAAPTCGGVPTGYYLPTAGGHTYVGTSPMGASPQTVTGTAPYAPTKAAPVAPVPPAPVPPAPEAPAAPAPVPPAPPAPSA